MIQLNNLQNYLGQEISSTVSAGGSITPTGAVANVITIPDVLAAGSITPTGNIPIIQVGLNDFQGSITPVGTLVTAITGYTVDVFGEIEPFGAVNNQGNKTFSGSITPVGVVFMTTGEVITGGSITPTGTLANSKLAIGGGMGGSGWIRRRRR